MVQIDIMHIRKSKETVFVGVRIFVNVKRLLNIVAPTGAWQQLLQDGIHTSCSYLKLLTLTLRVSIVSYGFHATNNSYWPICFSVSVKKK